jgi:hypothetical protein
MMGAEREGATGEHHMNSTKYLLTVEDGEEYTSLFALVMGDQVELCPLVCEEDTDTSIQDRLEAVDRRFGSHPSDQKYGGVVRLYRTGEARPHLDGGTSSAFKAQGRKLALQAAEDLYDQVWPAVGELSEQFVRGAVQDIKSTKRDYDNSHGREAIPSGVIESWFQSTPTGDLLRKLLLEEEKEFLATGTMTQKIGFVTSSGAAMMAVAVPYENYRWGRAVAEIARKVNAHKLIRITCGFLADPESGEKNGQRCLLGLSINPDGSIAASAHGVYAIDQGHLRVSHGITVTEPTLEKQSLIPGWQVAAKANAAN